MSRRIKASQVAGLPLMALRRAIGLRGRAPNRFARCIGAELSGGSHPSAPKGSGGKQNKGWQQQFTSAAQKCKRG